MDEELKFLKTKDAAIEKTGYPENPGSIAKTVIKKFWEQDSW